MEPLPVVSAVRLFSRQMGRCFFCLEEMTPDVYKRLENPRGWTRDHFVPSDLGGWMRTNNIVLSHAKCNSRKGNRPPTEAEVEAFVALYGEHVRRVVTKRVKEATRIHNARNCMHARIDE